MFPLGFFRSCSSLFLVFFWKGKHNLVSRSVVVQPPSAGGFSVIDLRLKVAALLVQWVTRFAVSPCSWVSFLSFCCSSRFHASALDVLSCPALTRSPPSPSLPSIVLFCPLGIWLVPLSLVIIHPPLSRICLLITLPLSPPFPPSLPTCFCSLRTVQPLIVSTSSFCSLVRAIGL